MRRTPYFSFLPLLLLFTLSTARQTDNDFPWQTLESGMLKVHWYQGDVDFGQAALESAQAGLDSIGRYLPAQLDRPIEIFVYANMDDLQSELAPDGEKWVAGHADPALGVVKIVIEPGPEQGILMEQRVPHELMHVMLYRQVGAGYDNIPIWLREGLATLAEVYPNAEYDRALLDAAAQDRLLPLRELCSSFPVEAGQAFLAYAESRSFTNHLHETYGSTGLRNLAASYADGVDCERGTERTFGLSLSKLESEWRSSALGENALLTSLQNIAPYLVLLCLVLIIPLVGVVGTIRKRKSS